MSRTLSPALLVHMGLAAILGDWLIDDAGITAAYARNLAEGYGLVSQPERESVEGFSNLLWVVVLYPTHLAGLLHPVWTLKLLGVAFVAFAMWRLAKLTADSACNVPSTWVTSAIPILLAATAAPVVIWSVSGLENGLMLGLVSLVVGELAAGRSSSPARSALWVTLLCATRPDGIIYFLAPAVAYLSNFIRRGQWRPLATYLMAGVSGVGLIFLFRAEIFGRLWPHPYYAKRMYPSLGARLEDLWANPTQIWTRIDELAAGVGGSFGWPLLTLAILGLVLRGARHVVRPVLLVAGIGAAAFVYLDPDWMGELRFATSPIALARMAAGVSALALLVELRGRVRAGAGVVLAVGLAALLTTDAGRVWNFATEAPTPYSVVRGETVRFNRYAEILGLDDASLLTADVGAQLMESRLRIIDLAGLCEPDVVATLKENTHVWLDHHPAFYDWVFEYLRPTFIRSHAFWTHVMNLEADSRFRRDYVPIHSSLDAYLMTTFGEARYSGDFVRREALTRSGALEDLRAERFPPDGPSLPALWLTSRSNTRSPGDLRDAARGDLQRWRPALAAHRMRAADHDAKSLEVLAFALDLAKRPDLATPIWREVAAAADKSGDVALASSARARVLGPW